jgi:hypothetical protein
MCLSVDPKNQLPITKPKSYNPEHYELLYRIVQKQNIQDLHKLWLLHYMPNGKTDINHRGGFSLDMIGMNHAYPEADYTTRAQIWKAHENYIKGLFYFLGNDQRLPISIRNEMKRFGYPKDEYIDNGGFSHQLYVREARRMVSDLVMTQAHCLRTEVVDDAVGMAAYQMDSHNCQRLVIDGMVRNEGNVEEHTPGTYGIAYRSIVPKKSECSNLFEPVCMSATHIAYGSIRMEPVFMVLAQSAALAAHMAIDAQIPIQNVDVRKIQKELVENPLITHKTPEIEIDNSTAEYVAVQGDWKKGDKWGRYAYDYLYDDDSVKSYKRVKFMPPVQKAGKYKVYVYCTDIKGKSTQIPVRIKHANGLDFVTLSNPVFVDRNYKVEWVYAGEFNFNEGKEAFVEVSNENTKGIVTADAVLLVPQF